MEVHGSKIILNAEGKILFFGLEHFLDDIAKGNCCFICGAYPESKEFNDEHIIPDWILRKFNLHSKFITLPNGAKIKYGQYTVPCCSDCNSELGKEYEEPISVLLNKNYKEIVGELAQNNHLFRLLFRWLCLIFLKAHLKDKVFRMERDKRKVSGFIGEGHYWEEIHHVHCITRSHYTGANVDKNVYGSIFILPALLIEGFGSFDYVDSQAGKAVMLQIGEFCIIAVLNDACAGYTIFSGELKKITGPLTPFQLREIVAHLNFINLHLKERPVYQSSFKDKEYKITATIPEMVSLLDEDEWIATPGQFLRYYVQGMLGDIENKESILKEIEEGKRTYLFNGKGEFINHKNIE